MKHFALFVIALCFLGIDAKTATVKLMTHDLESLGTFTNIAVGALSITGEGGKHWAVVVQFKDEALVSLCELRRNPLEVTPKGSGGIEGGCRIMTKAAATYAKKGIHVYNFGEVDTTPQKLKEMADDISINGQDYHLFLRNCQHWAKELLGKLGMSTTWFQVKRFLERSSGPGWIVSTFEKHTL